MMRQMLLIVVLLSMLGALMAKEAALLAEDPVIESRMLSMAEELRCLVCQNQSLAGSDSDFANDIRREMRTMMKQGQSDQEIKDFLVQRFGDFILFNPPVQSNTLPLWYGPLVLLVIGAMVLIFVLRRRVREGLVPQQLSEEDHRRAASMLSSQSTDGSNQNDQQTEGPKA